MEDADNQLVGAFLNTRSETAFLQVYHRHTPALFLTALRLLNWIQPDAEDAVQETWKRAVPALPNFRWESTLRTWLTGILIRCSQEMRRKRNPESSPIDPEIIRTRTTASTHDLEKAIALLANGYRAVFLLHDLEGYTHDEIAAMLGIEPGTSKSQLSRARKMLRDHLSGSTEKRT